MEMLVLCGKSKTHEVKSTTVIGPGKIGGLPMPVKTTGGIAMQEYQGIAFALLYMENIKVVKLCVRAFF